MSVKKREERIFSRCELSEVVATREKKIHSYERRKEIFIHFKKHFFLRKKRNGGKAIAQKMFLLFLELLCILVLIPVECKRAVSLG